MKLEVESKYKMFDTWSITQEMLNNIRSITPDGSTILELGSGHGTEELSKYYKVYSIEHDIIWVGLYNSTYIHVPLVECTKKTFPYYYEHFNNNRNGGPIGPLTWYNPDILKEKLNTINPKYDMLIIDGPEPFRVGILSYLNLFNLNIPIIIDDLNCQWYDGHLIIANEIAKLKNRKLDTFETKYKNYEPKTYGIVK